MEVALRGSKLLMEWVHGLEVTDFSVIRQGAFAGEIFVLVLNGNTVNLAYELPTQFGSNPLHNALLAICRIFFASAVCPVTINQVRHLVVDLLLYVEMSVFIPVGKLLVLHLLRDVEPANSYALLSTLSQTSLFREVNASSRICDRIEGQAFVVEFFSLV